MVLVAHLYRRVMRRGRLVGLLLLASVPALALGIGSLGNPRPINPDFYPEILTTAGFTFAIAALIITVAILRDERDGGTMSYIYMRPIPRTRFAFFAIAAGFLAALTVGAIGWAISAVVALLIGIPLSVVIPGLVLFVVASAGYAAVFVPLGYVVPRALLIGLSYVILFESLLGSTIEGIAHLGIWRIAISVYADIAPSFPRWLEDEVLGTVNAGVAGGLVKTAAVLLVGWALLTWALRRRDAV